MTEHDVRVLACPACHGELTFVGRRGGDELADGALVCAGCARRWAVRAGVPEMFDEAGVRGLDRFMRVVYDAFAPVHDVAVEYLLPVLQGSSSEALRAGYLPSLELSRLADRARPVRILEVGIGTGANLPLLARALPPRLPVEVWGCDISSGMLDRCRARTSAGGPAARLVLADAHALPFADATFDRVFHVGGISGFRAPRLALAEMARVARAGTPIVVVDEQLDPARCHGPYHRLAYFALTFYNPGVGCPRADLPPAAVDVAEWQLSRFYYCLRFRMPPPRETHPPVPPTRPGAP